MADDPAAGGRRCARPRGARRADRGRARGADPAAWRRGGARMRLNRLDLIRYGRFLDRTLDFGPAPADAPDVTVVYGANEAGKSTAFTAWLDLLFGFQGGAPYAFRFDRKELLVGAELDTPDGIQTLRRTAATTGSLIDANGHAVAEQRVSRWLRGLDREAYRTRFSLNDHILREGGKEIAQAQGDLGQLLHAGSSGLSGLSEALARVEAEVAEFHKKGGRKTEAAMGRNRLRELDAELRAARLDPRAFDRLAKARDDAETAFEAAGVALATARHALRLREAADARRGRAREIAAARRGLADYPDGPDLPAEAVSRVARAAQRRADLAAKEARARAEVLAARAALDGLRGDPEGEAIAAHLETVEAAVFGEGEPLLPRAQTALADLEKRRAERGEIAARMEALAVRLAGPGADPASVALPAAALEELRRAAGEVATAAAALEGEIRARTGAEAGLGPAVEAPPGLARLEEAVADWHRAPNLDEALAAARAAEDELRDATAGLPPDWPAAVAAGLPEIAEIDAVTEPFHEAARRRAARAERAAEAAEDWERAEADRAEQASRPDLVPGARVAEARAGRDAAWSAHRAALNAPTAEAFEQAMRADDAAREGYAAAAESRTRLAQATETAARLRAVRDRAAAALAAAGADLAAASTAVAALAARFGLPATAPADALRQRRDRLAAAALAAGRAEARRSVLAARRDTRAAALAALRDALGGEGEGVAETGLPAIAEQAIRDLRARKATADAWREARKTIEGMKASEARAARELAACEAALAARTAGLWCAGADATRLLAALPALEELAGRAAEHARIDHRIRAMEGAIETFGAVSRELRALLGLPEAASPAELLAAARRRAAEAEARDAAAEREGAAREIAGLLAGQGGAEDGDPTERVNLLARRDALRGQLAAAEQAYAEAAGGFDPAALVAEEAEEDPIRTETLRERVEEAERLRDDALARRVAARAALDTALAGEGGLAPDQERAALVERLRQSAREAAARHFGLLAARSALRRFRQEHRGLMLEATEQAFAHVTAGAWPRLDTRTQGAGEHLVGVRDGEPVAVSAMSTGTQGQLYLALRVAGHAAFVAEHGPLPFVTDDIHETFDDDRARAALELTGVMGRRGQAILFTHHRHLVDLARAALPGVRVIKLG
ncbi:MAG: hypothetical protein DI556_16900 [Rhodovulum sulfidophilum]|uniref:YhaN AAA domain-containing protein n=1 Tax=Rhodovulum sulfidophilum TaxID=35806 RepID=A0A2W5PS41_RHOSU|nr:MAG: hypothetical protein DI556_16900 [Rhodovulum sulfidophilum]